MNFDFFKYCIEPLLIMTTEDFLVPTPLNFVPKDSVFRNS